MAHFEALHLGSFFVSDQEFLDIVESYGIKKVIV
jgi:hypothetical protein